MREQYGIRLTNKGAVLGRERETTIEDQNVSPAFHC